MSPPIKPYQVDSTRADQYQQLIQETSSFILKQMKKHKATGVSVVLVDEGEVVWAQGFGYADVSTQRAADAHTVYKAGSITKVFTGTAIMQLVEQGKLDLDAPIQTYIPELHIRYHQPTDKPITLRHIMSHSSGLPVDALSGMFNRHPESFYTAIDYLNNMHAAYAPGTIATYSNLGTDLLGVVIERASGLSYADYMHENIFKPLSMQHSTVESADVDQALLSKSYLRHKENEEYDLRSLPAGNLHSNVLDMARFMSVALKHGAPLISRSGFEEMIKEQTRTNQFETDAKIGLNWVLVRPGLDYLGKVIWHNGGTINFMSSMVILPEQGLGVVVLCNSARSIGLVEEAANKILKLAAQTKNGVTPPPSSKGAESERIDVPQQVLQQSVGLYGTQMGPLKVTQKNDELFARLAGTTMQLYYHEDDWFSIHYRMFGFIPIPIPPLKNVRVRFEPFDSVTIVKARQAGITGVVGKSYQPLALPDSWRKALGKYKVGYIKDDYPWIDKFEIKEVDGVLVAKVSIANLGGGIFPLSPISEDMAIIEGMGRGAQETLYLEFSNGQPEIRYSGYRIVKQL